MRAVVTALLVLASLALPDCARGPGDAQCRTEFAGYRQQLGENGNPGTAAMPRLTKRWDALYDELEAKRKSAVSKDCTGELDRLKRTVGHPDGLVQHVRLRHGRAPPVCRGRPRAC